MKRIYFALILTLVFATFATQAVGQTAFSGAGIIESTTGGFKFPDGSVQLSATTPPCTAITYLPYTIIYEGVYCFTESLETSMTSGHAITIEVNNVVIDLNGWMLDGLGAGTRTFTDGIYSYRRNNITIRNGTIRGFYMGIFLRDAYPYVTSQGHVVEDIRAVKSTYTGINLSGTDNIARRNHVVNTGGSTLDTNYTANGIYTTGSGIRVVDNDIGQTAASGSSRAYAIYILTANGGVVEGNRINDVTSDTGATYGLGISSSDSVLVVGNRISNVSSFGVIYFSPSTGKYMDNLTHNVGTGFFLGTPVGVND